VDVADGFVDRPLDWLLILCDSVSTSVFRSGWLPPAFDHDAIQTQEKNISTPPALPLYTGEVGRLYLIASDA
jgi:hypothetical protein